MLTLLLNLMVADFLTGVLVGTKQHRLSSAVASAGLRQKLTMVIMLAVAKALEPYVSIPLSTMFASGFVVSELISLVENAKNLGVPLPGKMTDVLDHFATTKTGTPPVVTLVSHELASMIEQPTTIPVVIKPIPPDEQAAGG